MVAPVLYTSSKEDWSTPDQIYHELDYVYGFKLDAAASPENAKCWNYYTKEQDALTRDWTRYDGAVWCNPPYGRQIGRWVEKCIATAEAGTPVVLLVPSRTDTKWFHAAFRAARRVLFVRGRLKFGGAKAGAPFPSVVFVFGGPMPAVSVDFYNPGEPPLAVPEDRHTQA